MEWHNEEAARSMFSLVKSNNGLYRSIKQRDFMMTSNRGELAMKPGVMDAISKANKQGRHIPNENQPVN